MCDCHFSDQRLGMNKKCWSGINGLSRHECGNYHFMRQEGRSLNSNVTSRLRSRKSKKLVLWRPPPRGVCNVHSNSRTFCPKYPLFFYLIYIICVTVVRTADHRTVLVSLLFIFGGPGPKFHQDTYVDTLNVKLYCTLP